MIASGAVASAGAHHLILGARRRVAGWLEGAATAKGLGAWERLAGTLPLDPSRRVRLPVHSCVIGVGGATLGGSGRTPVAIALALALRDRGLDVALVGHGYRGRVGAARVVAPDDSVELVGDEALLAARALRDRAPVVVGRDRDEAIALAARHASFVVVDRLLQSRPRPLHYAVLAVDARTPWGSGRVVPFGDLVAPRTALVAAADEVLAVGGADAPERIALVGQGGALDGSSLVGVRVGVVTSVARPRRVLRALAAVGVAPAVHVERDDHSPSSTSERALLAGLASAHHLELWLACAKSALHLPRMAGVPVVSIAHSIEPSSRLIERMLRIAEARAARVAPYDASPIR